MPLAPFATAAELAARLGRTFTAAETAQGDAFCDDASQIIRDYCRQDFNAQAGLTATFESPDGPWLDFPQRPVAAVIQVAVNGAVVGDWSLIGDRLYRVYGWRWPSVDTIPPLAIYGLLSKVSVIYNAGYATIPPVVVTVARNAALRAMGNPLGLVSETIDDYSYRAAGRASGEPNAGVFITADERKSLNRYRRGAFSVDIGSGWS